MRPFLVREHHTGTLRSLLATHFEAACRVKPAVAASESRHACRRRHAIVQTGAKTNLRTLGVPVGYALRTSGAAAFLYGVRIHARTLNQYSTRGRPRKAFGQPARPGHRLSHQYTSVGEMAVASRVVWRMVNPSIRTMAGLGLVIQAFRLADVIPAAVGYHTLFQLVFAVVFVMPLIFVLAPTIGTGWGALGGAFAWASLKDVRVKNVRGGNYDRRVRATVSATVSAYALFAGGILCWVFLAHVDAVEDHSKLFLCLGVFLLATDWLKAPLSWYLFLGPTVPPYSQPNFRAWLAYSLIVPLLMYAISRRAGFNYNSLGLFGLVGGYALAVGPMIATVGLGFEILIRRRRDPSWSLTLRAIAWHAAAFLVAVMVVGFAYAISIALYPFGIDILDSPVSSFDPDAPRGIVGYVLFWALVGGPMTMMAGSLAWLDLYAINRFAYDLQSCIRRT